MHWKFALASIALLGVLGPALAKDQARVVIDSGSLISVSEIAVTEINLGSGHATIQYFDGKQFEFRMNVSRNQDAVFSWPRPIWVRVGPAFDIDSDTHLLGGPCGSQASALASAIELVEAACAGDAADSASCNSAQTALDDAWDAYHDCRLIYYSIK